MTVGVKRFRYAKVFFRCLGTVRLASAKSRTPNVVGGTAVFQGHASVYGGPVIVHLEVCDHEVLLVMSPVTQATGWRIVDICLVHSVVKYDVYSLISGSHWFHRFVSLTSVSVLQDFPWLVTRRTSSR